MPNYKAEDVSEARLLIFRTFFLYSYNRNGNRLVFSKSEWSCIFNTGKCMMKSAGRWSSN